MSLETTRLRLGFIPLSDAAPLIVAKQQGFFAAEGLDVDLVREASWANVRDRVAAGLLDGAHMLGPMAVAQALGIGSDPVAITVPLALNLNGSAITVSTAIADALRELDPEGMRRRPRTAAALGRLIERRRAKGLAPLTFAVVFPYSIHNYELRYWLAAAGIHADRDIRLTVVPPPRMVEKLAAGEIDGFCVGAPWNTWAVKQGLGEILLYASEWWGATPDKVFGLTRAWAERHPDTLRAALRALLRAGRWADAPENRGALATLLARPEHVGSPEDVVRMSLTGSPPLIQGDPVSDSHDYLVFHRYAASFPWRSHAIWFLTQMVRWGQAPRSADFAAAADVYRPDLYRAAAADIGDPSPEADFKTEGLHAAPWTLEDASSPIPMAADAFLDGAVFDPDAPLGYVDAFAVSRVAASR